MRAIAIIPARMAASRFPGKPMRKIIGMPMVEHCYHRACLALGSEAVYVATCDLEIDSHIKSLNGKSIMTSTQHNRATTRTAEALQIIENKEGLNVDVVVMVQGDEPLVPPDVISKTLVHFEDTKVDVVNVMSRILTKEVFNDKNNVKVVVNSNNDALYFSREAIPSGGLNDKKFPMYMQTGIIAFRKTALLHFNQMQETTLEICESVDMNRLLEGNKAIRMVPTEVCTLGIDTEDELAIAADLLEIDPTCKLYIY